MLMEAARLEREHALDSGGQGAGEGVVEEVQLLQRGQGPQRGRQRAIEVVAVRAQQLQRRPRCTRHTERGETPGAKVSAVHVSHPEKRGALYRSDSQTQATARVDELVIMLSIPAHIRSAVCMLYAEDDGG